MQDPEIVSRTLLSAGNPDNPLPVQMVSQLEVLGAVIASDGSSADAIDQRLAIATRIFYSTISLFTSSTLPSERVLTITLSGLSPAPFGDRARGFSPNPMSTVWLGGKG
jgi:hypothetical protein